MLFCSQSNYLELINFINFITNQLVPTVYFIHAIRQTQRDRIFYIEARRGQGKL